MVAVVNNQKNCKHILGVVDKWRSKMFSFMLEKQKLQILYRRISNGEWVSNDRRLD